MVYVRFEKRPGQPGKEILYCGPYLSVRVGEDKLYAAAASGLEPFVLASRADGGWAVHDDTCGAAPVYETFIVSSKSLEKP